MLTIEVNEHIRCIMEKDSQHFITESDCIVVKITKLNDARSHLRVEYQEEMHNTVTMAYLLLTLLKTFNGSSLASYFLMASIVWFQVVRLILGENSVDFLYKRGKEEGGTDEGRRIHSFAFVLDLMWLGDAFGNKLGEGPKDSQEKSFVRVNEDSGSIA
ncbi:hypothetical protein ACH5RR_002703 [Cinchona calisaya]|uniref:Uncharacterized protein n=1 Tax=Cinchona calisaya TaxID=153742 RepID=A0ABD3ASQ6_9GENT